MTGYGLKVNYSLINLQTYNLQLATFQLSTPYLIHRPVQRDDALVEAVAPGFFPNCLQDANDEEVERQKGG